MKNRTLTAAALALVALGVLTQTAPRVAWVVGAQSNDAALAEALKRLEKTLTRHGSKVSGGLIRRLDAKDFRGCKITYELTPQVAPDHKGYVPFIERTTVDLATLHPAHIVVRGGDKGAVVGFVTRDGQPTIERRMAEQPHTFGDARWLSAHHIALSSRKGAEEARAALVQAVELCAR
ncbi:MAG TPA: hypothetical protein VFZ44_14795 [Pyrinomonadaceae bacterium]